MAGCWRSVVVADHPCTSTRGAAAWTLPGTAGAPAFRQATWGGATPPGSIGLPQEPPAAWGTSDGQLPMRLHSGGAPTSPGRQPASRRIDSQEHNHVDLVIGLGNPLRGDDGVGWWLAQRARRLRPTPRVLQVRQLTPELCVELAAARRVLFIDAWVQPPSQPPGCTLAAAPQQRTDGAAAATLATKAPLIATTSQSAAAIQHRSGRQTDSPSTRGAQSDALQAWDGSSPAVVPAPVAWSGRTHAAAQRSMAATAARGDGRQLLLARLNQHQGWPGGNASAEIGVCSHQLVPPQLLAITALLQGKAPQAWMLLVPAVAFDHGAAFSIDLQRLLPQAEALLRRWIRRQTVQAQPDGNAQAPVPGRQRRRLLFHIWRVGRSARQRHKWVDRLAFPRGRWPGPLAPCRCSRAAAGRMWRRRIRRRRLRSGQYRSWQHRKRLERGRDNRPRNPQGWVNQPAPAAPAHRRLLNKAPRIAGLSCQAPQGSLSATLISWLHLLRSRLAADVVQQTRSAVHRANREASLAGVNSRQKPAHESGQGSAAWRVTLDHA
jgi:Ni,Fe-hydrogenase maturation factor